MRPSLTFNLGLRYEYYGVPYEANGLMGALVGGGVAGFGYSGRSFADYWSFGPRKGEDSTVQFIGPNSPHPDIRLYKKDWNNWAPAVGFSWSLPWFGKDKTTIRGGYGVSYQGGGRGLELDSAVTTNLPGINDTKTFTPSTFTDLSTLQLPVPRNKPLQPVPLTQRNTNLTTWDPNYVSPYIQNFTFSVTREVTRRLAVDLRYVGTKGTKLFGSIPINQANFLTNGLTEALDITRAGGDAPLFDQMLTGLNINPGVAGFGPVGTVVNGVRQTGSAALRQNTTYRGLIANGNYTAVAATLNTSTFTGQAGGLLRNGGFAENFITNNPQFNNVSLNTNPSRSIYHSMQAQFTMRPVAGLQYQATYLWSKGISDCQGNTCQIWINPVDRRLNRTLQPSDRLHDFRANGSFELPLGPDKLLLSKSHGAVARLVEGWQMSWIVNLTSGAPLDVTSINTYIGASRPQIVGPFPKGQGKAHMTSTLPVFFEPGTYQLVTDPQCASVTTLQATRTACTTQAISDAQGRIILRNAAPGTLGNLGQAWLTGPGSFRFDLSAAKTVKISESRSVQFRVDARNVLNHPILGNPDLNINSPGFGQIPPTVTLAGAVGQPSNITGSRQFQAQLRFSF